ncbi:MAG: ribosome maturation factor RimP [Nitrospirae bacterium]|nr:ribosome maturation factor RimP [Nitrospirota bacterium]MCL5236236.1 ribosome maturation factor RimP [Nitrospirota bacterium]
MMDTNSAKQKVYKLASQVAEEEGLELVSADILGTGRRLLVRVVVDKEGGVTIGDCERMSRSLEALMDVEDPIKGPYVLEVSSPGLDRPLTQQRDFEKNIGKLVRIVTTEKIDNQTFLIGRISDVGDGWIRLNIESKGHGKDLFVPLDRVSKARLEIEMKKG